MKQKNDGCVYCGKFFQTTYHDGWSIMTAINKNNATIKGTFEASHPIHGRVHGNFENAIYADSEEGYANFVLNHIKSISLLF